MTSTPQKPTGKNTEFKELCAKLKRKSVRCYFSERCGNDSNPSYFYKTVRPFLHKQKYGFIISYSTSRNDEIISDPIL